MIFTIYNPISGEIVRCGTCPDSMIDIQAQAGEGMLLVESCSSLNYVLNGQLCDYTPEELATKNSLKSGWVWKMPERTAVDTRSIDTARAFAWQRVKQARADAELAPFTHAGFEYDSNKEQIMGAVQMATLATMTGAPFSIEWTLRDNSVKSHSASEMISLGVALGARVSAIYDACRQLRVQIDAADSNTAVESVIADLSLIDPSNKEVS